ncbi:MAG TPA: methionyl-tRNA formyltransferase [Gemmatimonadaceae bacterium]|nr:MAG: methionyl-tRNA formyltransferase [Gemmatimonadetes bacterium SCN 70-22]HMN07936.1 methionyl-tRNA formyltransferase [Gemmatimonadaceae bacterium]
MRVLFWGTPEFATPPLRALLGEGYEVVGVVTQPDKPQGRSRSTLVPSPVKVIALEEGLPVLQPERPRGEEFEGALRALAPDISVVVAYGHILPQSVIDLPPLGTLNIHASLLPRWRGAAPIQAAILAGDDETGVSIMRMVRRMDAGPVILQAPTPILGDETYGELQLRLSELGALAIVEALTLIAMGAAQEDAQDEVLATYAGKVEREHTLVNWTGDARQVARQIRAYDPRPGAYTTLRGVDVKLSGVRLAPDAEGDPGLVLAIDEGGMLVACRTGGVRVAYVQPAGKRRLAALDWAQGRGVAAGDILGAAE